MRFGNNCVDTVSHVFLWLFINIMTKLSQYMMIINYCFFFNCQELFSLRSHLGVILNSVDSDECNLPDRAYYQGQYLDTILLVCLKEQDG